MTRTARGRRSTRVVMSAPKAGGDDCRDELERQAEAVQALCERRGGAASRWRDVENGHAKGMERPGLLYALERIAEGEASCLVVSELERLSRNAADLGRIVEWCDEERRSSRRHRPEARTGSAAGRRTARTLIRSASGKASESPNRPQGSGGGEGSPRHDWPAGCGGSPALKERIVAMRNEGLTLQASPTVSTPSASHVRGGSEWRPSSVQAAAGPANPRANEQTRATARKVSGMS